jgi:S1-C subfamily serine protease
VADDPDAWTLPMRLRPRPEAFDFDLDRALSSVLSLSAEVPDDAFTASALGTERVGNGVLIREDGVVVTIGYLVTEATEVTLRAVTGREVQGHVLGYDQITGFGLVQALEPLDLPALSLGDSRRVDVGDEVVVASGGGRKRALTSRLQARQAFAGYWEYLLEEALFTAPAHPLWSGAAVIGATGELIGVGSLQLEQQGEGGRVVPFNMSVPAELLSPIFDDLLRGKPTGPARPWLGVLAQDVGDDVVVLGVSNGGPASRAELREGDVIVGVAGQPVRDLEGFYRRLWSLGAPGVDVPLTLRRGSDVFDMEVRSADRRQALRKPKYH